MSHAYAAGGLYPTVEDIYLWDQALYTDKILSQTPIAQAFPPARLNDCRSELRILDQ